MRAMAYCHYPLRTSEHWLNLARQIVDNATTIDRRFLATSDPLNTLARVLQCRSKHDHITPALIQLHWLLIQRVTYKLATLTFKTLKF